MENADRSGASGQPFADLLRTLRHAAGLTQAELAERASLSTRGLSDLERGINRSPQRETLLALADGLGLAEQDRARFFAAARRRPPHAPVSSGSLPASTPSEPDPEPGDHQADHTPDIQIFLIADVRGYSTYTDAHRDEEAAQLALRFADLAAAAVQTHGGQVVEVRGDEVLAVFTSARAALRAAMLLLEQAGQASASTPQQPIRCGIGVEAGEAVAVPGGYRGQAINLAARLCSRAAAGEVLAGETVIGLARKVKGLVFQDRGLATLKGIANPVRITQVVAVPAPTEVLDERQGEQAVLPEPVESPRRVAAVGNFLSAEPRQRLVAREVEMATLLSALDRVQAGTGQLVLLVGEPGVGKTRLAQEVLQAARAQGFGGITGRCYAPQANVPYYPFLEVMAHATASAPLAVRTAIPLQWPEVARLIPDQRLGTPTDSMPHPEGAGGMADQQRLFWQVTGFLQALADEQALAILVDDLHWADGASLELLLHLARQTRDRPILLLGTYRESEVPWDSPLSVGVRDLIRAQLVERIELQQLSRQATAALVAASLEAGEVSEAVIDLIYGPTEGNAFFVQELLRTLLERGDIVQQSTGRWEPREGVVVAVPATVQAAVLERVSRLSAPAQETLGLASVLGQRFQFDDLLATTTQILRTSEALTTTAALSEVDAETRLEAELEEAVRARVLREVGGSDYGFSHALAQRALYEQLSLRRRRRLHRAVAQSLERLAEAERVRRVTDLAYHFLQADEPAQALPYVLQAGEQALLVYAYAEARQRFGTALELARQLGDRDAETIAQEQLLLSVAFLDRYDESQVELEHAATVAEQHGDLKRLARLALLFSTSRVDRDTQSTWIARLLRLIETTKASGASPELARFYLSLAIVYFWNEQVVEGLSALEQALQVALVVGDARLVTEVRLWHGMALSYLGRLDEALAEIKPVALLMLDDGEDLLTLDLKRGALTGLGIVLSHLGRLVEAHTCFEGALRLAERLRTPGVVVLACTLCGQTAFALGDWPAAHRYLRRAGTLRPHVSSTGGVNVILLVADARLHLAQGQLAESTQRAEESLAIAVQLQSLQGQRLAQQMLAELDLHRGDPASALARLLPLLDRTGMVELDVNPLLPLLVWAHLDLGEVEAAEVLAGQTVERLHDQHDHLTLVDALRMQAAVWIQQQRWLEAEAALEEALALARAMPYPYAEAKLLATYGDLLVASGQPVRAREHYEAALSILQPLGEVPYAERIEQALTEIRRHRPSTGSPLRDKG